jgi:hypothetical protein
MIRVYQIFQPRIRNRSEDPSGVLHGADRMRKSHPYLCAAWRRNLSFAACLVIGGFAGASDAGAISDTALIRNHYTQNGKSVARRDLETMLRAIDTSESFAARSRACRITGGVIGFSISAASAGVAIAQMTRLVRDIQEQRPITPILTEWTLPLTISSEIGAFAQERLASRAEYLLYKGVSAYNFQLSRRKGLDSLFNHRISRIKLDWYMQDSLTFPAPTLHYILAENSASRGGAVASVICNEIGSQVLGIGMAYLCLGIIAAAEDGEYRTNVTIGVSVTGGAIVTLIAGRISRALAVRAYNSAIATRIPTGIFEDVPR